MEFTKGNILRADTEAIVNTVNCVGIMGRGIAAQFKREYPANFKAYEAACKRKEVVPGRMFMFETGQLTNPRFIVNFPTKRHWRGASRIEDCERLRKARQDIGDNTRSWFVFMLEELLSPQLTDDQQRSIVDLLVARRLQPDHHKGLPRFWSTERSAIGPPSEAWLAANQGQFT